MRRAFALAFALAAVGLAALPAAGVAGAATTTTTTTPTGVTARSVTVGGLLGGSAGPAGADVGAQARFRRANRAGGVAGRRVRYLGTQYDGDDPAQATAAVAKLAGQTFAVVPAVSPVLDTAALARARLPFFGAADTTGWNANRFGFGYAGPRASLDTRAVDPSWGVQLRALLGEGNGNRSTVVVESGALGAARAAQARTALRAAGFRVAAPVVLTPPVADPAGVAKTVVATQPAAVLLLTSSPTTAAVAAELARLSFTGTVATSEAFYQPTLPAVASGLTVLVPFAPLEQRTAANRRLAADVEAFAPGTPVTPAVIAGYWSADQFLALLARVGRTLTVDRLLAAANRDGFTYAVPATVGPVRWPDAHRVPVPCGALVQSDGAAFHVVGPYRCSPVLRAGGASAKGHATGT